MYSRSKESEYIMWFMCHSLEDVTRVRNLCEDTLLD